MCIKALKIVIINFWECNEVYLGKYCASVTMAASLNAYTPFPNA